MRFSSFLFFEMFCQCCVHTLSCPVYKHIVLNINWAVCFIGAESPINSPYLFNMHKSGVLSQSLKGNEMRKLMSSS